MRAAANDLDQMTSSWGATEDQLMNEYKNIRQAARGKKRNARYGTRSGRQYSRAGGPRKPRSPDHRNIHGSVSFFIPEAAYREDEEHVATLVLQRGGDSQKALRFLGALASAVEWIAAEVYGEFETEARERLAKRDPEDWPILTSALALGCPIWREDTDFFGCGRRNVDIRSRADVLSRIALRQDVLTRVANRIP